MKSLKNIISFLFLTVFVFFTPLKTDALTIEEVINDLNSLHPINMTDIKNNVNYDYQKEIEEISSILDASLDNSKSANDKLVELNTLMNSINNDNKALLSIEDKTEYDESVAALKEKVEAAKQINANAKTSSQNGLDKYNEALAKYVSLKSELEDKKATTEAIFNTAINIVNTKLDAINNLLEELTKIENKLEDAYNEAYNAYESAKENAEVANNNFSEKLEELKEYVEVNGEQELNDLIEVNTNYLTSGVLYATSQVALKLIDFEIELVNAEIASLNEELSSLDEQLEDYEKAVSDLEAEKVELIASKDALEDALEENGDSTTIQEKIDAINSILTTIEGQQEQLEETQQKCANYMPALKDAIANDKYETIVRLLLENEPDYGFTDKIIAQDGIKIVKGLDSNWNLVDYIFVTYKDSEDSPEKTLVYSYEKTEKDGEVVVTIYNQELVEERTADEITGSFTLGKYKAYTDETTSYYISSINFWGIKYTGFSIGLKSYKVEKDGENWIATPLTGGNSINIDVKEAEHYEKDPNGNHITSAVAIQNCEDAAEGDYTESINKYKEELKVLEEEKLPLAQELEEQIEAINTEITNKEAEITAAEAELENQKATITSESGMTYAEIEAKLAVLDENLNRKPSIEDGIKLTDLIYKVTQGNFDIQSIIETISNLNVGLNTKKEIINTINTILANNYNNAKQELIDVAGEDLENVSNILKEIAPLISDVAKSNLKLLEEKVKYEVAKSSYDALLTTKELVLEAKDDTEAKLEVLEKLKDESNIDLSEFDAKFKETEDALVTVEDEVEVKINDYVVIEDENNGVGNVKPEETPDTNVKEENNTNKNNQSNNAIKEENKVENDTTEKDDTNEENTTPDKVFDPDEESEGFNLLWLLPIALIIFFIIILIKRKKDEE